MKPILFPFTLINKPFAECLEHCFSHVKVIKPSSWSAQIQNYADFIEYCYPEPDNKDKIDSFLKQIEQWAGFYKNDEISYLKNVLTEIPFFDDDSIQKIRDTIKQKISSTDKTEDRLKNRESDPFFKAQMFLHFAHKLDAVNAELEENFLSIGNMEQEMFREIKHASQTNELFKKKRKDEFYDINTDMTAERLSAWSLIMQNTQISQTCCFYVTTGRNIFDYILNLNPESSLIKIASISIGKKTQQYKKRIIELVKNIAAESWNGTAKGFDDLSDTKNSSNMFLNLYIFPDTPPDMFFQKFILHNYQTSQKTLAKFKNTVLGVVCSSEQTS